MTIFFRASYFYLCVVKKKTFKNFWKLVHNLSKIIYGILRA